MAPGEKFPKGLPPEEPVDEVVPELELVLPPELELLEVVPELELVVVVLVLVLATLVTVKLCGLNDQLEPLPTATEPEVAPLGTVTFTVVALTLVMPAL